MRCSGCQHLIDVSHSLGTCSAGFASLTGTVLAVEDGLAALVHLDLCDNTVGSIDTALHSLTIGLISSDSLNVDDILLSVAGNHLAFLTSELANLNANLVILADGKRAYLENI